MNMTKNKSAFTLIELLVVIAIIGVLAGIALVNLNSVRKEGNDTKRVSDLRNLDLALQLYYNKNSSYPNSLNDLVTGKYIQSVPVDPQGNSYTYATSSDAQSYVLKTTLSDYHSVLDNDVDGSNVLGQDCDDDKATKKYNFCLGNAQ